MSDSFRAQVYKNLNLKTTEELVEIWLENDRDAWTDMAFDVVKEILMDRLGEVPSQEEYVILQNQKAAEEQKLLEQQKENEDNAVFYEPIEVQNLERWIHRMALYIIVASVIISIMIIPDTQVILLGYFSSNESWAAILSWFFAIFLYMLLIPFECALIYYPLKGFVYILKLLMAMEFTSRGADINQLPKLAPDNFAKRYPFIKDTFPTGKFPF